MHQRGTVVTAFDRRPHGGPPVLFGPGPKPRGFLGLRVVSLSPALATRKRILATWWGLFLSSSKAYISIFVITFHFRHFTHEQNVKSSK